MRSWSRSRGAPAPPAAPRTNSQNYVVLVLAGTVVVVVVVDDVVVVVDVEVDVVLDVVVGVGPELTFRTTTEPRAAFVVGCGA